MARTKQTCRKPTTVPRLPRQRLATMTASGFRPSSPDSPPKKKGPVSVFLSGEVRDLEQDIMHHPFPESTQPRQSPAMTRYRGSEPRAPKKRVRRRKPKLPTLMKPEALERELVTPVTDPEDRDIPPPTVPEVISLPPSPKIVSIPTVPDVSTPQPEVIDLTLTSLPPSPKIVSIPIVPDVSTPQPEVIDLTAED
ncbi:hypothetical protein EDB85DRAFT_1888145 [Lactarius pseudohatsudake]|nr:hypothetical protein EDB85DRAFT_1888145 [Lactarius pseudohatsudake]